MILPTTPPTIKGVHISHILICKVLLASKGFVSDGDVSSLSDFV
jgi:hypothetical protein